MQFAHAGDLRAEAEPGLRALCPGCGSEVIAKCGEFKIWHWAHIGKRNCDHWWEPETPWHRNWKNKFPKEMREVRCKAESGEAHIADIRNPAGLVIEFQHSPIKPDERRSREAYYRNMVWVVDGTRLKRDLNRFEKGSRHLRQFVEGNRGSLSVFTIHDSAECFARQWIESSVPVLIDFGEVTGQDTSMWCLLPERAEGLAVVVKVPRSLFVVSATSQPHIMKGISKAVADLLKDHAPPKPTPSPPLLGFQQYLYRLDRSRRRF